MSSFQGLVLPVWAYIAVIPIHSTRFLSECHLFAPIVHIERHEAGE